MFVVTKKKERKKEGRCTRVREIERKSDVRWKTTQKKMLTDGEDKGQGSKDTARRNETGLHLRVLNINSNRLSLPVPTMNNPRSTHLCQHAKLFIHNHILALAHTVEHPVRVHGRLPA